MAREVAAIRYAAGETIPDRLQQIAGILYPPGTTPPARFVRWASDVYYPSSSVPGHLQPVGMRLYTLADTIPDRLRKVAIVPPLPLIARDTFTRADSATTLGSAETGQAWSALVGTWGISSNTAYVAVDAGENIAVLDSGHSDGAVEVTFPTMGEGVRLAFRATDSANYYIVTAEVASSRWNLFKQEASVFASLGTAAILPASGDVVRVTLAGSAIKVFINGTERISVTNAFNQTATKHGIGGAQVNAGRIDNFKVTT